MKVLIQRFKKHIYSLYNSEYNCYNWVGDGSCTILKSTKRRRYK